MRTQARLIDLSLSIKKAFRPSRLKDFEAFFSEVELPEISVQKMKRNKMIIDRVYSS
jgi:hypothetical protein